MASTTTNHTSFLCWGLILGAALVLLSSCSGSESSSGNTNTIGGATTGGYASGTATTATGGSSTLAGGSSGVGGTTSQGGTETNTTARATSSNPATGGSATSGGTSATGGAAPGGEKATGGITSPGGTKATGGSAKGGTVNAGGAKAVGGSATGGTAAIGGNKASGGNATGGNATGGNATGGNATGGNATGGTSNGGGATNCSTPPDASPLVGWAAMSNNGTPTTTGGGNATPVTVTTLAELQNAVKGTNAAVIYVTGKLAAGNISVGSNKTIVGLCGAEIHGHVEMSGSVNVIVRNIKIVGYGVGNCALDPSYDSGEGCSSGADAISVQKSAHHIWFDHCDISDGTDGNLDITNQADFVTISWTKFHYTPRTDNVGSDSTGASGHRYSNLVGGSDTSPDAGTLNITWHHCWWADNVHERQPQVRFGKNHLFNNLWTAKGNNYCVRAVIDSHILIEGSVFSGVKDPHIFYSGANSTSNISANAATITYPGSTGTKATGGSGAAFTTPPYAYTLDATADVEAAIRSGAGPH